MEELQAASVHSDERELLQLLSTPHLRVVTPQSLPTHASVSPGMGQGTKIRGRVEHSWLSPKAGLCCCMAMIFLWKVLLISGEFKLSVLTYAESRSFRIHHRTPVLVPNSKKGPTEITVDFLSLDQGFAIFI